MDAFVILVSIKAPLVSEVDDLDRTSVFLTLKEVFMFYSCGFTGGKIVDTTHIPDCTFLLILIKH